MRFRRALGHADLYYIEDRDLDFKEVSFGSQFILIAKFASSGTSSVVNHVQLNLL